jgi:phage terminase large subunit-like protein
MLLAGNQLGKTLAASMELAYHTSGQYPPWWKGKRYPGPTNWWVGNTNNETVRDGPQKLLLGEPGDWGTGTIPRSCIAKKPTMSRGFPDLVDVAYIKHVSGGISTIQFKAYDQGRKRWQGATLKGGIWFDEEPPWEIYSEGLARITSTTGVTLITMTPLLGMSDVVTQFFPEPTTSERALVQMTIDDATHLTEEERAVVVAGYKDHERDARARGLPMLGEGLIFQVPRDAIEHELSEVPRHWHVLGGIDFGYGDHPFAAVKCALDRDADCLYLTHAYKERSMVPAVHASAIRPWGETLRYAWPHDGHRDWGDSGPIADVYRKEGLRMLREHATFQQGGFSTEAAISLLLARMQTQRFKAASHLTQFWAEIATYHRKDGAIVKKNDDVLSALFKVVMMLRYARQPTDSATRYPEKVVSEWDPFAAEV